MQNSYTSILTASSRAILAMALTSFGHNLTRVAQTVDENTALEIALVMQRALQLREGLLRGRAHEAENARN